MCSKLMLSLFVFVVASLAIIVEAKPTFSWMDKGASLPIHRLRTHHRRHENLVEQNEEDHEIVATPSTSYQKSSPLKTDDVTPSVESQKSSKNFFGINHDHESFKPSKYDKNCFFSPVNCVIYRSKIDGVKVMLRRAET